MRHLEGGNGSQTAHRIRELMQNENAQHGDVQWVQPAETKQCKTPDAESFDKTLLVVRRDDEPAQHEKEVDKQITVPQQRDIGKVAVGPSSEMIERHEARRDPAPAVEHIKAFPLIHAQPTDALNACIHIQLCAILSILPA